MAPRCASGPCTTVPSLCMCTPLLVRCWDSNCIPTLSHTPIYTPIFPSPPSPAACLVCHHLPGRVTGLLRTHFGLRSGPVLWQLPCRVPPLIFMANAERAVTNVQNLNPSLPTHSRPPQFTRTSEAHVSDRRRRSWALTRRRAPVVIFLIDDPPLWISSSTFFP